MTVRPWARSEAALVGRLVRRRFIGNSGSPLRCRPWLRLEMVYPRLVL